MSIGVNCRHFCILYCYFVYNFCIIFPTNILNPKSYSRFQVTFQSAFPKFVLNIPNYITKFGILRENLQRQICMLVN